MFTIQGYLPVVKSFGFTKELHSITNGKALPQAMFDRWETMNGSPLDKGSELEETVKQIRTRKGLKVLVK